MNDSAFQNLFRTCDLTSAQVAKVRKSPPDSLFRRGEREAPEDFLAKAGYQGILELPKLRNAFQLGIT